MVVLVLLGLGLHFVYILSAAWLLLAKIGVAAYMGPRDTLPEPGVFRARALKASANSAESLPVFLTLALLSLILEDANMPLAIMGAQMYLVARVAYLAVYLAGVPYIRSAVFTAAAAGLVIMGYALF
jgi:uncharacterized MAPEG superfamily protein